MTNEQIVELYAANKEAIDAVWAELGDEATLKDATLEWMARTKRQSGCNWLMRLFTKGHVQ